MYKCIRHRDNKVHNVTHKSSRFAFKKNPHEGRIYNSQPTELLDRKVEFALCAWCRGQQGLESAEKSRRADTLSEPTAFSTEVFLNPTSSCCCCSVGCTCLVDRYVQRTVMKYTRQDGRSFVSFVFETRIAVYRTRNRLWTNSSGVCRNQVKTRWEMSTGHKNCSARYFSLQISSSRL